MSVVQGEKELSAVAYRGLPQPHSNARILATGKAISPADAAICTTDPIRTAMFLRGAAAAICELRRRLPNGVLEIVYAGTGPLAPLVLPLFATGTLVNAHVTFIDINEASLAAVRELVELVGGSRHTFCVADAATYRHGRTIHLVITETMQRALTVEPQMAIAMNLVSQLHARGLMVPQCVRVDLRAEEPEAAQGNYIGEVIELSVEAIRHRTVASPRTLVMPRVNGNIFYSTSIQTYGEYYVGPNESGLTMPEYLWEMTGVSEGETITFFYERSDCPRIQYIRRATAA